MGYIWTYNQQISTMSGPTVTFHGFPSSHRQNPWPGCHPIAPVEAQEQRHLTRTLALRRASHGDFAEPSYYLKR